MPLLFFLKFKNSFYPFHNTTNATLPFHLIRKVLMTVVNLQPQTSRTAAQNLLTLTQSAHKLPKIESDLSRSRKWSHYAAWSCKKFDSEIAPSTENRRHFECQTASLVTRSIIRAANFQVHAADKTTIKSISDWDPSSLLSFKQV